MKNEDQQVTENIFNDILIKILNKRNLKKNIQSHDPQPSKEPEHYSQPNLSFKAKKRKGKALTKPRQLTLPLKVSASKNPKLKTYTDVDKFVKDNFVKNIYIGPDLSEYGFNLSHNSEFRLKPGTEVDTPFRDTMYIIPGPIMKYFNAAVRKRIKAEKEADKEREQRMKDLTSKHEPPFPPSDYNEEDINVNELSAIIHEIVEEELREVNHTTDSSGKSIIAQGAPGSVIRFATENPDIIKQMRDWVKDCQWVDLPDDQAVDELSDEELLRGIQNGYEGGIKAFIRDSNSSAETPVGYKESLNENFDDEMPDGYTNDLQRAYAHSQATTPRENAIPKATELAKQGKYVIVVEYPVYCKSTDACLGGESKIHKVLNTPEELEKELKALEPRMEGSDTDIKVITPDSVKPQQKPKDTSGDEDVPFEGVGYVYDRDMKKDPKHIPGERWRVKFQEGVTKNDLKDVIKELITEMWFGSKNDAGGDEEHDSPLNEIIGGYDAMIEIIKNLPPEEQAKLNSFVKSKKDISAYDAVLQYFEDLAKRHPETQS